MIFLILMSIHKAFQTKVLVMGKYIIDNVSQKNLETKMSN